jgi:hypothetical protein
MYATSRSGELLRIDGLHTFRFEGRKRGNVVTTLYPIYTRLELSHFLAVVLFERAFSGQRGFTSVKFN